MKEIIKTRIEQLRRQMELCGVDAWYISGTDPHQSEYMPGYWQARKFISGFTGSAGTVAITREQAALWTDSRYFLQAEDQLRGTGIELMKTRMEDTPEPAEWLGKVLKRDSIVGTDTLCMSLNQYRNFRSSLSKRELLLKDTGDLLKELWIDREPLPTTSIFEHEQKYSGQSRLQKIDKIRERMARSGANATLISALDDLAWTFNLRGGDIEYNPVFVGYGLITKTEIALFVNPVKVSFEIRDKLKTEGITLKPYEALTDDLGKMRGTIIIDPDRLNQALLEALKPDVEIIEQVSIPTMLKAIKSDFEIRNFRETSRKDGVAMVEFLFWLHQNIGNQPVSEYDLVLQLDHFRSFQEGYRGHSFFPIIGYNAAGAIVHRSVTKDTALQVMKEGILLFDSGGQYLTGTTDITRTVALSEPAGLQRTDFTIVLKGMIGLTMAKFPAGTKGCNLDLLTRKSLWDNGMNYGHGTGHGIGYFLNVHEGPMSIRQEYNEHPIMPGMVLSNEPGFYREGQYGLRTENMILCVEREKTEYGRFYGFETLTLCPIDRKLIDKNSLTVKETEWIDLYHQRCRTELSPYLSPEKQAFLWEITSPLG